jgi:integrase
MAKAPAGIRARHSRGCNSRDGRNCNCTPKHEAWVWSNRDGKKIYRSFDSQAEVKGWRADATSAVRKGAMRSPSQLTIREAWEAWLEGAKDGSIRNRSGDRYKPSVLRSYETSMRLRVLEDFGASRLSEFGRLDAQDLADRLLAVPLDPSTVRNASCRSVCSTGGPWRGETYRSTPGWRGACSGPRAS